MKNIRKQIGKKIRYAKAWAKDFKRIFFKNYFHGVIVAVIFLLIVFATGSFIYARNSTKQLRETTTQKQQLESELHTRAVELQELIKDKNTTKKQLDAKKAEYEALEDRYKALEQSKARRGVVYAAAPVTRSAGSDSLEQWLYKLRMCESGGNYSINTGNGYYGAYQFAAATWNHWNTGYAYAHQAPPSVQDATIIKNTNASSGGLATQNPGCYRSQGLSQFPPS